MLMCVILITAVIFFNYETSYVLNNLIVLLLMVMFAFNTCVAYSLFIHRQ